MSVHKEEPFQNIRLHDIWALEKIKKTPLNRALVGQTPFIEIHVNRKKIYGNDGCAEFSGDVSHLDNNVLTFVNLDTHEKKCQKMKGDNEFQDLLKEVKQYQLKGLKLIFFDKKKKELMQFKKVD